MLTDKDRKFGGDFGTSPFKRHLPGKPLLAR